MFAVFHNQSRLITMLWLSVRSSWQLNKITKMDETNIQPFWPKKCGHKELLYGLAAKMWILTKTPHGYIRLLNIRVTHGYIRLHIRRSGKTRKQNADYPASSGFSRPDATLRRVTVRPGETTASEGERGYESVLVFLKLWKFWKKALQKIPVLK